jgi:hypothetical protein
VIKNDREDEEAEESQAIAWVVYMNLCLRKDLPVMRELERGGWMDERILQRISEPPDGSDLPPAFGIRTTQ